MKKQTISRIAQWVAIVSALVAGALQTAAILTSYAAGRNYFEAGAILPTVAAILALFAGACGILSASFCKKEQLLSPVVNSILPGIPAACGFAYGAFLLLTSSASPWTIPASLAMLATALYSLLFSKKNVQRFPRALALLGFLAVAACAMINVYCYFDTSLEMNAPVKVTVQTALLFAMIYYTAEIRFLLGREKPRLYLALSYCTVAALSLPAVSIPVAYVAGVVDRTDYFAFAVTALGLLLTVLLRTLCDTGIFKRNADMEIPDNNTSNDTANEEEKETDEE